VSDGCVVLGRGVGWEALNSATMEQSKERNRLPVAATVPGLLIADTHLLLLKASFCSGPTNLTIAS
jgi:hypothetical protein